LLPGTNILIAITSKFMDFMIQASTKTI
jgi:hypothetical protein